MQSAKKWTGKEIYFEFVWHSICPFCFAKKKKEEKKRVGPAADHEK